MVLALCAAGCAAPPPRPANVIVYLVDTLRADHLTVYGYDRPTTPEVQSFAATATTFERAYAQTSWTKPSVGSLFTGLFPSRHGAQRPGQSLRSDVTTFAEQFKQHGYHTAAFVTNPNVLSDFGFGRGFDEFHDVGASDRTGLASEVTDEVRSLLGRRPDKPLFIYIHVRDPHSPYGAPDEFRKSMFPPAPERRQLTEEQRLPYLYDGEIRYVDHHFGVLVKELRRLGLYDDTLMAFVSDHGEEFGEHGGRGHGHTLYEELVHVPMIIHLPNGKPGPRVVDRPVRLMDLMPTVLDLFGFQVPAGIDGVSFASLFGSSEGHYDPLLYAQLFSREHGVSSFMSPPYKVIRRTEPVAQRGLQLFNLGRDPGERRDLALDERGRRDQMERSLETVEAGLASGVYLELVNGADVSQRHVFTGSITAVGAGAFDKVDLSTGASPRQAVLSSDRRRIDFRVELQNRPNPVGQDPAVLIDLARLRLELPDGVSFRTEIRLDGVEIKGADLILGAAAVQGPLPSDLKARDPRLRLAAGATEATLQPGPGGHPRARLYAVPAVTALEGPMDPSVAERLRALGYIR